VLVQAGTAGMLCSLGVPPSALPHTPSMIHCFTDRRGQSWGRRAAHAPLMWVPWLCGSALAHCTKVHRVSKRVLPVWAWVLYSYGLNCTEGHQLNDCPAGGQVWNSTHACSALVAPMPARLILPASSVCWRAGAGPRVLGARQAARA
jgi:hypothetical protein